MDCLTYALNRKISVQRDFSLAENGATVYPKQSPSKELSFRRDGQLGRAPTVIGQSDQVDSWFLLALCATLPSSLSGF